MSLQSPEDACCGDPPEKEKEKGLWPCVALCRPKFTTYRWDRR